MKIPFNDVVKFTETEKRTADILRQSPIVPLIGIDEEDRFEDLIEAAIAASPEGLVPAIEVLLRNEKAIDQGLARLAELKKQFGDRVHILAGSIIKPEDVERVAAASLDGLVSGGYSKRVADAALQKGMPYLPGFMTLDEVKMAHEKGLTLIKLFPARSPDVKSITAPLSRTGVQFVENTSENAAVRVCGTATEVLAAWEEGAEKVILIPAETEWPETMAYLLANGMQACCTGGVTAENLAEFSKEPAITGVGASFITGKADKKNFRESVRQNLSAAISNWSNTPAPEAPRLEK
ncbi:MAG: bifunctional 4-hydroxy-2-oxoglutarate aldolase/2-dehydro-3-deoxy-phosphogluconate aldolase [Alphaproteobacteria bacterium]